MGLRIILFLDNGLGGELSFEKCLSTSQFVNADLRKFDF
jgi:hypothetical protein